MLERRKKKIDEVSLLSKIATYVNVNNNITEQDEFEDIVKKLIQASNVNINEFENRLSEFNIKNKRVINIADKYLMIQMNNISRLEKFI